MEEENFRSFGNLDITLFIGEERLILTSMEDLVAYMMETDNWFKPDRFLIRWEEHGIKGPLEFDSNDTDRW